MPADASRTHHSGSPLDKPRRRGRRLLWILVGVTVAAVAIGGVLGFVRYSEHKRADDSAANMWQTTLGIQSHHDSFNRTVDDIRDKNGKPLLSWRVAILPFIEQDNVYREFHLDEPWDSPHNLPLLAKMPSTFRHPDQAKGVTETHYQLMTGPGTLFDGTKKKLTTADVPDGFEATALLFEAGQAVPWTKPADMMYAPGTPLPALRRSVNGHQVAFADGMVRSVPHSTDEETRLALVTPRGGESVAMERFPKNRHVVELNDRLEKFMQGHFGRR